MKPILPALAHRPVLLSGIAALLFSMPAARAASDSWKANADGLWNDTASWTGGNIPGSTALFNSTDVATFGFTLATPGKTVTVDADRNIGGITFSNTSAFGYTLSGGNLKLSNGGVIQLTGNAGAHTETVSSPIEIEGDGGAATFTNASTLATRLLNIGAVTGVSTGPNITTLTLNGAQAPSGVLETVVSGVVGDGSGGGKLAIVKSDGGAWTLSNTANTFSGGITLNTGILRATTAGAMGLGTVTLAGGQLHIINNTNTNFGNNVVVSGSTQISTTRVSGSAGTISHTLGTLSIGAQTLTIGKFSSTTTGSLTFGATTLTGDATFATASGTVLTLGAVSGAFSLTKTTNGGTLVLPAANSYSGATNLNGGVVRISASNNLGDGSATNTLSFNSGTLQSTANTYSLGLNRVVALTGAATFQVDAGKLTVDGAVTGAGTLSKTGIGILELTNASYAAATFIQNGVLQTNNTASNFVLGTVNATFNYGVLGLTSNFTGALGTAPGNVSWATGVNVSGGFAVLDAATRSVNIGGNVTPDTLTVGTTNFVGGTLTGSNSRIKLGDVNGVGLGTVDFQNSINLGAGDRSLIFVVDGAAQYSGKVSGNIAGSGATAGTGDAIVKFGNANLLLTGNNTYTGRTIVGGTAAVVVTSAAAFSPNTWMHLDGSSAGTIGGILGLQYDLTANLGQAGGNVHFATSGGFAAFGADHSVTLNSGAPLVWASTTSFVANGQNLILGQGKADGKITLVNDIDLGAAVRTVFVNRGTAPMDGVLSGNLTGIGGGLVKAGAGILNLTGTNSYDAGTAITAGTLNVAGDSSLGAVAGPVAITNNAILQAGGAVSTTARTLTLGTGGGTIDTNGNPVTLGVGTTVTGTTLTKTGNGTLTLAGTQSYATLNVQAGRTNLASSLANATINANGGRLDLDADATNSTLNVNTGNMTYITANQTLAALNITGYVELTSTPPAALSIGVAAVPEPGSLALLLTGALGFLARRRRG